MVHPHTRGARVCHDPAPGASWHAGTPSCNSPRMARSCGTRTSAAPDAWGCSAADPGCRSCSHNGTTRADPSSYTSTSASYGAFDRSCASDVDVPLPARHFYSHRSPASAVMRGSIRPESNAALICDPRRANFRMAGSVWRHHLPRFRSLCARTCQSETTQVSLDMPYRSFVRAACFSTAMVADEWRMR